MKKTLLALSFLTLSGLLVLLHGQSANSLRFRLVGTWRLVSATQRLADGTVRPDPQTGPKGAGYLIYTDTGQVCVVVCNPERSRWASVQAPTDADLRNAFGGLVTYAGTFEVNETERYVVHHIEVDRVPNLTGTDRKRFVSFSANRLVLSAAPPLPTDVKEWKIVWERVGR
ncbi:MAG: lipocalin-like domain-containing protein [Limisphaerales bacterium]